LIGPAVAGILIAAVGEGLCFAINSVNYLTVVGALMMQMGSSNTIADDRRRSEMSPKVSLYGRGFLRVLSRDRAMDQQA
jgi:hypothetical protein